MSGHSHWAGIRHHKGINDAKRAALFTKVGRNIIMAAERGGGNPETNFALRLAIDQARAVNMPKSNIEKALARGTGELKDAEKIEEIVYEAYLPVRSQTEEDGPGSAALLIETLTDNRNRTVSEVKNILTKTGGKFGSAGSVKFLFERIGVLSFRITPEQKEEIELLALDSGASDFSFQDERFVVFTETDALQSVQSFFESHQYQAEEALLGYRPFQPVNLSEKDRVAFEKLRDALEDHPDVQRVWDNLQ